MIPVSDDLLRVRCNLLLDFIFLVFLLFVFLVSLGREVLGLLDGAILAGYFRLKRQQFLVEPVAFLEEDGASVGFGELFGFQISDFLSILILVLLQGIRHDVDLARAGLDTLLQLFVLVFELLVTLLLRLVPLFQGVTFIVEFVFQGQEMLVQRDLVPQERLISRSAIFLLNLLLLEHLNLSLHGSDLPLQVIDIF